jgi:hypothetical protein
VHLETKREYMQKQLSNDDKAKLAAIHKALSLLPSTEHAFMKMESLFYDALSIARDYSTSDEKNSFLYNLLRLKEEEFKTAQEKYTKARQHEVAIKQFRSAFKKELSTYLRVGSKV